MKINRLRFVWICGLLFLLFSLLGCAGNLYSINLYYDGTKAVIPGYLQSSGKSAGADMAVAEFTDMRQIDDRLVIGHVVKANGSKYPVFPKDIPVTKSIAHGIKNYLKKAGYNVGDKLEQWNVKEESIPRGDTRVLIGGSIDEMEIQCRKGYLTNTYAGDLKLTVFFADMASGKILHRTQVESKYSREHLLFSENILAEQADIVLADAIEKLFEDKVVAKKLKEALGR
ncbi:MAG: hypothetical protein WBN66_07110 [Smithella sp.]